MDAYLENNMMILDLTVAENAIAEKVFPIMKPLLVAAAKDLMAMSINIVVEMKDILDKFKETGKLPSKEDISANMGLVEGYMTHLQKAKTLDINIIMKAAEINLDDLKEYL